MSEFVIKTTEGCTAKVNDLVLKQIEQANQTALKETNHTNETLLKLVEQTYCAIDLLRKMCSEEKGNKQLYVFTLILLN